MREKPNKDGHVISDNGLTDLDQWPVASPERNLEGKGKPKWYDFLPYEKFVQYLPKLRYLRGSKAKFTITTFEEINKVCQQIFECNKSFFRFRSQVDLMAHYLGTKMMEQIYIVQQCNKQYPLSKVLEEQEEQFQIWDQMKTIKEIFQNLCEKLADGFITQKELDAHVERYIATFESPEDRIKMASVIEHMVSNGETYKAKDRNRKNYANKQKAIEKGFQVFE
jgi:hypothetical protein